MKIKIITENPNELKLEIEGVGHTFCNLLQKRLLDEEKVDFAGYDIPHPLDSNPVIYLRTVGYNPPRELLWETVKRTCNLNDEFKSKLKGTLKT